MIVLMQFSSGGDWNPEPLSFNATLRVHAITIYVQIKFALYTRKQTIKFALFAKHTTHRHYKYGH